MNKKLAIKVLIYVIFQITTLLSFGVLTAEELFNPATWPGVKEEINRQLVSDELKTNSVNFQYAVIKDVDLSEMNFKKILFNGSKFINVDLSNAQLHFTGIVNVVFKQVSFKGAVIYYGRNSWDCDHSYKVPTEDPEALIREYAHLREEIEKNKSIGDNTAAYGSEMKASVINRLIGMLKIELCGVDFRGLNLLHICLDSADLKKVNFQNTKIEGARMEHTKIFRCSFRGANLSRSGLSRSEIYETEFGGANLNWTSFGCALINGCEFAGACTQAIMMDGAKFRKDCILPSPCNRVDLVERSYLHPSIEELARGVDILKPVVPSTPSILEKSEKPMWREMPAECIASINIDEHYVYKSGEEIGDDFVLVESF